LLPNEVMSVLRLDVGAGRAARPRLVHPSAEKNNPQLLDDVLGVHMWGARECVRVVHT
jgi:hypothetical protein